MSVIAGTAKLCDVCGKEDRFQDMNMQTCGSCGVYIIDPIR